MRLRIEEYLSMLKESDELDRIIPNLLAAMNIEVISSPQRGTRQHGVDIHGIGPDKTNFLITIKKGNITRGVWDNGLHSVRSSLNEIKDGYIQKMSSEHKKSPHKIILCYGGHMDQNVQDNWNGFTKEERKENYQFENWGGSKISGLIEEYLINEYLFLEEVKQYMKRTLACLSDHDYQFLHYREMLKKLLDKNIWDKKSELKKEKDAVRVINIVSICLSMINQYSMEYKNLKHIIISSELSMLNVWSFILENEFCKNRKIMKQYFNLLDQYNKCLLQYFEKLEKYFYIKDGICGQSQESITSAIITFEQIGMLATFGLHYLMYPTPKEDEGIQENKSKNIFSISNALVHLIKNNNVSSSPCFDGQVIDICLALYLLACTNKIKESKEWIRNIIYRFHFAYNFYGKGFPISKDSIDTLIEFEFENKYLKEKMVDLSTLIPTIAYWCAILDFKEEYQCILKLVSNLKETHLQLWFPEKGIRKILYTQYVENKYGITEIIELPQDLNELKQKIKKYIPFAKENGRFETTWDDLLPVLPFLASRQYRTPVVPFLWIPLLKNFNKPLEKSQQDSPMPPTDSQTSLKP